MNKDENKHNINCCIKERGLKKNCDIVILAEYPDDIDELISSI